MTAFKGIWTQEFWRCVGAEFFAMLLFVLLSLGSTINWGAVEEDPCPPDLVLISLCFGLSIATMVQCFVHISGAHINPAVTAAMVVTRKLSLAKAVFYLLAQCVGAIVGAAILFGITPASVRGGMGVTTNSSSPFNWSSLCLQFCDHKRNDLKGSSALAIGLSVCIGHLFAVRLMLVVIVPSDSLHWSQHEPCPILWPSHGHVVLGQPLVLYEYLFCPDPELKKHYSEAFIKTPFTAAKHQQDSVTVQEPLFPIMDVERAERKERERAREVSGEVLSSV
ncbi:hypothetical protein L3Q82_025412 [Scortum barcoo]|uniref:Uncharacterized protein n=1 Tax=Scortum barcoo TaxID=214431 RepID=A0ACB8WLM2_9TELE|nr:hypothetical protein L3Q82_025412 [Scortum barcoo]